MNKFEIYLTDLENFGKTEKKTKIKAESFGNVNRYLLGMRFFCTCSCRWKNFRWVGRKRYLQLLIKRGDSKALKDLARLKTICDNGKVLELPYTKTLLQNTSNWDGSFQNSKCNYFRGQKSQFVIMHSYGPTKLLNASKAVSKITHIKNIIQATRKALNSWTVMEKAPKENTKGSGCEMGHEEEDSGNGNDKQSDDDDGEHFAGRRQRERRKLSCRVISLYRSEFLNWFIDQTIRKISFKYQRSNILVEEGIQESLGLC